jgi:hypothetical protein
MLESARFHFTHRLKSGADWTIEIDPIRAECATGDRQDMIPVTFEHVSAILAHDETARRRGMYLVELLQRAAPFRFPAGMRQKLLSRLSCWIRHHHPVVLPFPGRRGRSA